MVTLREIQAAGERIGPHVHRTPLIYSSSFSVMTGAEVFLKAENLQKTGSFKVRGAFNRISRISGAQVAAASMGNHAQGVAYAAARTGKHATIVMPVAAPIVKQEATRGYGADVVLRGEGFSEALDYALSLKDHVFIHAFDDDEVIAGQGTVGVEILEELPQADCILVPVGGGGLIAGIAAAAKELSPKTKVLGVQTRSAAAGYVSFRDKRITEVAPEPTIADGIAVGRMGDKPFQVVRRCVDDMVVVDEDSIAMAILLFLERKKLVVEGAGAVPLAALLSDRERYRGRRVVLVVSGGNIDFTLIDRIIHKGLVTSGRIGVFEVIVDDAPGRLHALTGVIASCKGNIVNVVHDRLGSDLPVVKTRVIFTVEIRGKGHLDEIISGLAAAGFEAKER